MIHRNQQRISIHANHYNYLIKAVMNNQERNQNFKCRICGNTDIQSIGYLNGKPYCRRCISFKGEEVEHKPSYPKKAPIHLSYELSPEQKELSDKLVDNYKKGIDSLVFAVCGSGKTEISLATIQYALMCGDKVAFAVPRKDVVIELANRLKQIFKNNKVISLYGGHHDDIYGDVVVLTTHQLYRYKKYFALIILDEIDAFPFKNNEVLKNIFFNASCGNYILMSATPSKEVIDHFQGDGKEMLKLEIRFHGHAMPVPSFIIKKKIILYFYLLSEIKRALQNGRVLFVFAPTIEKCESLFHFISIFFKNGDYVHSQRQRREKIIDKFRQKKLSFIVTTSILERGITLEKLDVIVFESNHSIYDKGTLVQISGRVGRKSSDAYGKVTFMADKLTKSMEEARYDIMQSNKALQDMF